MSYYYPDFTDEETGTERHREIYQPAEVTVVEVAEFEFRLRESGSTVHVLHYYVYCLWSSANIILILWVYLFIQQIGIPRCPNRL